LHLTGPKLLVVGECGDLPFDANAAHPFFHQASHRNERRPMFATGDRSVVELCESFVDAVVVTRSAAMSTGSTRTAP